MASLHDISFTYTKKNYLYKNREENEASIRLSLSDILIPLLLIHSFFLCVILLPGFIDFIHFKYGHAWKLKITSPI